jgi:hypothetical protein
MRFLRPSPDECILHDRLPPKSGLSGVFSGTCAFHRKYSGKYLQEPLGNQANFVINFCQILFDA